MIPLVTVNLALEAVIAICKLLATEQGKQMLDDGIKNREMIAGWWKSITNSETSPSLKAFTNLFK